MSYWDEDSREFDRVGYRCNVSVASLGKRYNLTIAEAEAVQVWVDDWFDDPEYYYGFFNFARSNGKTEFEQWLETQRNPPRKNLAEAVTSFFRNLRARLAI